MPDRQEELKGYIEELNGFNRDGVRINPESETDLQKLHKMMSRNFLDREGDVISENPIELLLAGDVISPRNEEDILTEEKMAKEPLSSEELAE